MLRWKAGEGQSRQSAMTPDARPDRLGAHGNHCPRTYGGDHRDDRTASKITSHRIVGRRPGLMLINEATWSGVKGRTMLKHVSSAAGGAIKL